MRILFVTPELPGKEKPKELERTDRFLRELAAAGHQVDLASFVQKRKNKESIAYLSKYCDQIKTVWNPPFWAFFKMLLGVLAMTPFRVLGCTSVRMHFLLKRLAQQKDYDVVHLASSRMMEFSPCFEQLPILVDHINGLVENDQSKRSLNPLKPFERFKAKRYEQKIKNRHSYAVTANAESAKALNYSRVNIVSDVWDMSSSKILSDNYNRAIRLNSAYLEEKKQGILPLDIYYQEQVEPLETTEGRRFDGFFRRIFDISMAMIGLILSSPICLVVTVLILLQDGKPIIFTQKRVGKDGKLFKLFKFRTMIKDAEKKTGAVFANKNDPRITALGRFLRLSRLDEIPQLINVLRGDMSLIGPRPERPEFTNDFAKQIPFYDKRLNVKPGVTGWAQVRFPYASSLDDTKKKLEYDLFYIKNRSVGMTLSILFQTVAVVFTGRGAR